MAKPVNLNRFRKEKTRADKKARADENAIAYGRTNTQKKQDRAEAEKQVAHLDQHRRKRDEEP